MNLPIMKSLQKLPFFVRLSFMPFFILAMIGLFLIDCFDTILLGAVGLGVVYLFGFIQSTVPLESVIGASVGSLFTVVFLSILYFKTGEGLKKSGLKIIDWVFTAVSISLMGCFQILGVEPLYWVELVLIPLVLVRVAIQWFMSRMPKVTVIKPKLLPTKPEPIIFDDAGLWIDTHAIYEKQLLEVNEQLAKLAEQDRKQRHNLCVSPQS